MAIAAVVWLGFQFWRLLSGAAPIWPTSPPGAIDLKLLHRLVHHWFAGHQVYREFDSAVYPPATYVLLWPLLPSTGSSATAGVLLAAALLLTIAPGGLFLLPPPWSTAYVFAQTIVWVATLTFLLGRARTGAAERRREGLDAWNARGQATRARSWLTRAID